jgi:hypothetical protein
VVNGREGEASRLGQGIGVMASGVGSCRTVVAGAKAA